MIDEGIVLYRYINGEANPIAYCNEKESSYWVDTEKLLRDNGMEPNEEIHDVHVTYEVGSIVIQITVYNTVTYDKTYYYIRPAKLVFTD